MHSRISKRIINAESAEDAERRGDENMFWD
jgi:hypothetical protein